MFGSLYTGDSARGIKETSHLCNSESSPDGLSTASSIMAIRRLLAGTDIISVHCGTWKQERPAEETCSCTVRQRQRARDGVITDRLSGSRLRSSSLFHSKRSGPCTAQRVGDEERNGQTSKYAEKVQKDRTFTEGKVQRGSRGKRITGKRAMVRGWLSPRQSFTKPVPHPASAPLPCPMHTNRESARSLRMIESHLRSTLPSLDRSSRVPKKGTGFRTRTRSRRPFLARRRRPVLPCSF